MIASSAAAALSSFLVLALVFTPLERLMPARSGQRWLRPGFAVDACFFAGQYLVWSGVAVAILTWAHGLSAEHAPGALRAWSAAHPAWLQALFALVLGDACVYWFHRASHRFGFLWRFHAVHHSAEHLDWIAAHREHPVDGVATQLCQNLPAFVLGLPMDTLAALVVFRGAWGIFIHSNVRLPLGPLAWLVGAPELHHWHHARLDRTRHNFANLAPWLDVVFGTFHRPRRRETFELGLVDPWPRGYLAQLLHPFGLARPPARTEGPVDA